MIQKVEFPDLVKIDDGVMATAVNAALKRAAEDCEDRPGVKRPRVVTIKLSVTPVLSDGGICDEVKYGFEMSESIPKRASKQYVFGLRKNGVMTANPDALDNHRQETFGFDGGDK